MPAPFVEMQHPVTGAVASTTVAAFQAVWEAKGWLLTNGAAMPIQGIDAKLKAWVAAESYDPVGVISRSAAGVVTAAIVKWPDGSNGVFTATLVNDSFDEVDAYTVTHAHSGRTVTQVQVTRDDAGDVIYKPELVVI